MSILNTIKAKAEKFWQEVTGEARAELQQAVAEAETELAKVGPLLTEFKADVATAVKAAEPAVQTAVAALLQKLLEDAGSVLGQDLVEKPQPPAAA
jgi:F0F1-type ATP synthase membrane subunit b/b'